jgi:protein ImuB
VEPRTFRSGGAAGTAAFRDHFATLARWGIRTCGELAALPRADLHARMGPTGVRLHQAACGEDIMPLTPVDETRRFVDRMELEWPIEGLEPLSFVLARQFDRLSATLERADRGATAITTHLTLVNKTRHTRELQLPAPMREARVLRTLVLLDLESHPPAAGIDVVEIVLEVAPGHILQGSLLAYAVPSQEDLSTLLARLGALMGESRLGAPLVLDTFDERQVALRPFRLGFRSSENLRTEPRNPGTPEPRNLCRFTLRRFRLPIAVRVALERGTPVRVVAGASGVPAGRVVTCAGPWRSSGGWWHLDRTDWDRDAWDVELESGVLCRLARHRVTSLWEIEGVFD